MTATCWRQGVEPLTVVHVSRRDWLLTCSLPLLGGGSAAFLVRPPQRRQPDHARRLVLGLSDAVAGGRAGRPVFLADARCRDPLRLRCPACWCCCWRSVHLILQERQRRQIVFLPSFRRGGSSILREPKGSSARHGEPSTVDVPRQTAANGQPAKC